MKTKLQTDPPVALHRLVRLLPLQRRTEELKVWPASQFQPGDMVLDKEQGEKLKIAAVELDAALGRAKAEIKRLRHVLHAIADSRPDKHMDVEKTPELVKWICETCRNVSVGAYLPNVKEHAPLSAEASVDHGVEVETTEEHRNRAADRGCCGSSCSPSWFMLRG